MSEPSPQPQPFGYDLAYQTPALNESGRTHIKLAGIFNLIMGGLDLLYGLGLFVAVVCIYLVFTGKLGRRPPAGPDEPPLWLMVTMYGSMGIFSSVAGILKLIAGIKLLRRGVNARVWGYIAGIAGCTQIWCSLFCVVPLGCGVYTIVAMSLTSVRYFLAQPMAAPAGPYQATPPM